MCPWGFVEVLPAVFLYFFFSSTKASFSRRKRNFICIQPALQSTKTGRSTAAFHPSVTICISVISGHISGDWNVSLFKAPSRRSHPSGCWLAAVPCTRRSHVTQLLHPEQCSEVIQVGMCFPCSAVPALQREDFSSQMCHFCFVREQSAQLKILECHLRSCIAVATCDFGSAAASQGSRLVWISNHIRAPAQSAYGICDLGGHITVSITWVWSRSNSAEAGAIIHAPLGSESNP